jgi:hypothetical protein
MQKKIEIEIVLENGIGRLTMVENEVFFYNVFRATRYKTTSLPAALNQARRIDTLFEGVLSFIV